MRKILVVYFVLVFLGCSHPQVPTVLTEKYSFLLPDGEMTILKQSNDTLYQYDCYVGQPCPMKTQNRYKIIETHKSGNFMILKLERLDSIPLNESFCPGNRFSIMAFKKIDSMQLKYRGVPFACLTPQQADSIQTDTLFLNKGASLTFYSDSYLRQLSKLKKISTKDAAREIIDAIENNDFNSGRVSYYAEELTKACIEKGYNPVGAGVIIDSLWRTK
jgi:hypothetical protein